LCKANGVLTPLLAGVAYLVLLRPASPADATRRTMDRAALLCLALPAFVVVGYLIHIAMLAWPLPRIPGRDWSLTERLLSEPRVLCQYLWRLALPRAVGGLYGDAFPPSRGWTAPWTTLPSLLALLAITSTALLARHRAPIACFAWCFFLVGHLLESTTVPLELYFEHRNYVPALFLGWPIAHSLLRPGTYSRYRVVALGLLLAAWLLLTAQRASLWGNAQLLHAVAARSEEGSPRAQFFAAMDAHDPRDALARMHRAQRLAPDSMDLAIGSIALECETRGALDPATLAAARQTLATSHTWNYRLAQWLQEAPSWRDLRDCRGLGLDGLSSLLDAAASNPGMTGPRRRRDLDNARGRIALAAGQPDKALRWFDAALSEEPDPDYALVQAAALGDASAPALGVRHLDTFARLNVHRAAPPVRDMTSLHTWLLSHYGYYRHETALLRVALQRAAEDQAHSTPSTRR
jgi:tetratricopeptide (TPR) repeat protein